MLKDSENKDAAWTFLKEASYEMKTWQRKHAVQE